MLALASSASSAALCSPSRISVSSTRKRSTSRCLVQCSNSSDAETVSVGLNKDFQHVLLPIIDKNPYLSDGTRQAAASATALAKKYGAKLTVVVIDEEKKEGDYEQRLQTIRWHLAEGGFQEYGMLERIGEGKQPAVVIGELADDMGLDLVVLSMDCIHSKHIDGNLLAEFIPCPVLLLPL